MTSVGGTFSRGRAVFQARVLGAVDRAVRQVRGHHAPSGALGDPWSIGATALWAALLLVAYLLMAYF